MSEPAAATAWQQLSSGLAQLSPWLDEAAAHADELAALRALIDELIVPVEAQAWTRWVSALRRLESMLEVCDCLAADSGGASEEVRSFCQRALDHLTQAAAQQDPEPDIAWIETESDERWGGYLQLLNSGQTEPLEDDLEPPNAPLEFDELDVEEAEPAINLNDLLRLLTQQAGAAVEEPSDPAETAWEPSQEAIGPQPVTETRELNDSQPPVAGSSHSDPSEPPQPLTRGPLSAEALAPLAELDAELREAFLADATDLFERIQVLVLEDLGKAGQQSKSLRELSRCFHTLKGAGGSVGLSALVERIHMLEDQLELAAEGRAAVPIDTLHEAIGNLEEVLDAINRLKGHSGTSLAPEPPTAIPTPLPENVSAVAQHGRETSQESPGASSVSDGTVRISNERVDELMDLVSDLIVRRSAWAAQAEALKDFAASARSARNRLVGSLDRLRDLLPARDTGALTWIQRLNEQTDDLAALAETARRAADPLADDADALARITVRLWDSLQAVRVVPVRGLFHRLARVAREAARVEARPIEVVLIGEDAGLDRSVQDRAFEPLLHAVRNAVGHGIEPLEERLRAGKPPLGRITLEAKREGYTMLLKVQDDGRGLDFAAITAQGRRLGLIGPAEEPTPERLQSLVFRSGLSTRKQANSIAGRGVGMDVVAQEVARLHGTVSLSTQPGVGTTLTIRLPARLALEQAMVVRVDGRPFALPLNSIELAQPLESGDSEGASSPAATIRIRDQRVPLLDGRHILGMPPAPQSVRPKLLVVRAGTDSVALVVDAIDGPRELVIKPLGALLAGHPAIAGTSLSPAGELILVLDPAGLVRHTGSNLPLRSSESIPPPAARVLVVDDALSVRRAVRRQLRSLGLDTDEAADGLDALRRLRNGSYGVVIADLEMPRMDGFELLAELGRSGVLANTPVVVITSRSDSQTIHRVQELGARTLLPKPIGPEALAGALEPLLAGQPRRPRGPLKFQNETDSDVLAGSTGSLSEASWRAR